MRGVLAYGEIEPPPCSPDSTILCLLYLPRLVKKEWGQTEKVYAEKKEY